MYFQKEEGKRILFRLFNGRLHFLKTKIHILYSHNYMTEDKKLRKIGKEAFVYLSFYYPLATMECRLLTQNRISDFHD